MTRFGITKNFIMAQCGVLCLSLLLTALFRPEPIVWIVLAAIVMILSFVDFIITPGKHAFHCERCLPVSFEQTGGAEVELVIFCKQGHGKSIDVRVADSPPKTFRGGREVTSYAVSGRELHHKYTVIPMKRGVFPFGKCYIEVRGSLGLCTKRFSLLCEGNAKVYPNLAPMRHYRMLAEQKQLSREDSALHKIRGIGTEFVGIRDYSTGDDRRKINWKATARSGKLMTNLFDTEKNREVMLAVDTGRWMQADMAGVTRLDRALELAAAMMQIALSSGDRVGLILFDTKVTRYLGPGKGSAHFSTLLQALYNAQTKSGASNFSEMSTVMLQKLSKRAYIFILSYINSPETAVEAAGELMLLKRKHALFFASLSDMGVDTLMNKKAASSKDIYLKTAAAHQKAAELHAAAAFKRYGIGARSAEPNELLTHSIRHYLSLKRTLR